MRLTKGKYTKVLNLHETTEYSSVMHIYLHIIYIYIYISIEAETTNRDLLNPGVHGGVGSRKPATIDIMYVSSVMHICMYILYIIYIHTYEVIYYLHIYI